MATNIFSTYKNHEEIGVNANLAESAGFFNSDKKEQVINNSRSVFIGNIIAKLLPLAAMAIYTGLSFTSFAYKAENSNLEKAARYDLGASICSLAFLALELFIEIITGVAQKKIDNECQVSDNPNRANQMRQ